MCGRIKINKTVVLPGQVIPTVKKTDKPIIWGNPDRQSQPGPFARIETLGDVWLSKNYVKAEFPVEDFAELDHNNNRTPIWNGAPVVIQAIIKEFEKFYSVAVVTRDTTPEELEIFHHGRMPVVLSGKIKGVK